MRVAVAVFVPVGVAVDEEEDVGKAVGLRVGV